MKLFLNRDYFLRDCIFEKDFFKSIDKFTIENRSKEPFIERRRNEIHVRQIYSQIFDSILGIDKQRKSV